MSVANDLQAQAASGPARGQRALVLVLGLLLLVLTAVGGWLGLREVRVQRQGDLAIILDMALEAGERLAVNILHARRDEVLALAEQPAVRQEVTILLSLPRRADLPAVAQAQGRLHQFLAPLLKEPGAVGLAVVDRDQINILSQGLGSVAESNPLAERGNYLQSVLSGQRTQIPLLNLPASGGGQAYLPRLLVAAPIRDAQGQPVAVLVLAMDPVRGLKQVVGMCGMTPGSDCYLFDWFGRLPGQGPPRWMQANSPEALEPRRTADLAPRQSYQALAHGRATAGQPGGMDLEGYQNPAGQLVVGAWRWLPELGLGLAVDIRVEEAYAAYHQARGIAWAGMTLALTLFLGFWGLLWRQERATRALSRQLAQTNQELSRKVDHCQEAEARLLAGQERYHRVFDNARDIMLICRLEADGQPGVIHEANQMVQEVLGYAREQVLGLYLRDLIHPLADPSQAIPRLVDGQQVLLETLLLTRDGNLIPVEIKAHPFELDGEMMVLCLARDLSERRRARQELHEREARLRAIVDGFEGFIYICSEDFRLEFANENLKRHLGRDPVGEFCYQTIHGSQAPCVWCADASVRRGQTKRYEFQHPSDGRWYYMNISPLTHPDGRLSHHGMMTDITERRLAQERLEASEANYRAIFNAMEDAIILHDPETGAILDANPAALTLYGYGIDEIRAMAVADLSTDEAPFTQMQARDKLQLTMAGQPQRFEWMARDRGGRVFWVEVSLRLSRLGGQDRVLAQVRDISQRKRSEEQLQLAARVFENTVEGITVTDRNGVIQMVNPGFTLITGYTPEEAIGNNPRILRSNRHEPEFYQFMWAELQQNGQWSGEIWNRRKNGEAYPEWLNISAIKDEQGQVTHYVAVFHDITEIKASQEQIKYQAYHDALTGLPNRALFNDRLRMALGRAKRSGEYLAVVFLDLDHFKGINDSLGHAVGDLLLQEVASRLMTCLRQEDTVSRLGGDEFIMILPDLDGPGQAVLVTQRILEEMARPFQLKNHELYVTASLGITISPTDGDEPETLVKNADMAMYRAKELGRDTYQLYTPSMNQEVTQRQTLLGNLRKALERDEFLVYYQPKVDLATGRVGGMEALVRWLPPDGKLVSPGRFIPLAEETGLILPIGQAVLEKACRQTAQWARQGRPDLRVAVNLSARQFAQAQLLEIIQQALRDSGLEPRQLELEITESTVMGNVQAANQVLMALHDMGVCVTLDDFGTGYSSLYYLKHFHIDVLKIDQSFVRDIPGDSEANAIAEAVVSLARSLKLEVVAEGVETREQLEFLRGVGCDYMQGYLFSQPLPAEDFAALLQEDRHLDLTPRPPQG